jgi:DEAD/DEAH box helicase domain-containing protein
MVAIVVCSLLHVDANRFAGREALENWRGEIKNIFPEEMAAKFIAVDGDCLYGLSEPKDHHDQVEIEQFTLVEQEAVRPPGETSGVRLGCCLDDSELRREEDGFRLVWNGYLRLFNLCQFLPHAYFVTREGLRQRVYDRLKLLDDSIRETAELAGWRVYSLAAVLDNPAEYIPLVHGLGG